MKKLFFILALLITFITQAQVQRFQVGGVKGITTTQRDGLTVPSGQYWFCYNTTTAQYEYWDGDSWESMFGGGGGLANVVEDTTPQLGGDLDLNSNAIISNGNAQIDIDNDDNSTMNAFLVSHNGGTNLLDISETGSVIFGQIDTNWSALSIAGNSSTTGGQILFYNGASEDTTVDYWKIEADDNFVIYSGLSTSVFEVDSATLSLTAPQTSVADVVALGDQAISTKAYSDLNYGRLEENASVSGTYDLDYSLYETWYITLTGVTTFTESNLPTSGTYTSIKTIHITGDYSLTFPSNWSDNINGTYDGTVFNTIVVEYIKSGVYKVSIIQED